MFDSFSSADQRAAYIDHAARLARDPYADMPAWVRDDPARALQGRKVVLCGSKMPGEARFIAPHGEIVGVVDDFLRRDGRGHLGLPVLSTDEWIDMARQDRSIVSIIAVPSVIGDDHFARLAAQHELRCLRMLQAFRLLTAADERVTGVGDLFMYGVPFFRHAQDHVDEHLRCAEHLSDEYSRFTYFSILNFRLTADPRLLQRCAVGRNTERAGHGTYMFNRSFLDLAEDEVFVDGGAFDGDSVDEFVRAVNGRFRHVYAFEPSPDMAARCRVRVAAMQSRYLTPVSVRISVVERGLWDREARLLFNPTQYAPTVTALGGSAPLAGHVIEAGVSEHLYAPEEEADGSFSIDTVSIDQACAEPVSLIKLEVEGSELKALEGARETIARHRPRLAVSVYHKPEDLVTLLDSIVQTGQGYKMHLRQHNPHLPDAMVCYCV